MTTLSSLIVARQAASIAQVDEALARQVVRGGDLGTCVLELGMIGEGALLPLLAEAYGFEAVGPGELPAANPTALRLVPPAVALRYGIYPLEERGGELHVAVSEPLPQPVEDDLGFALGTNLRQSIAPLVRIRQAIARDYGLPLDRRFARLVAKLERRPDPSPSDMPPRADQTPPFPGGGVRLSKSGTMIVDSAVPPPAPPLSEQTPQNLPPQRIIAPPTRRNTWPGLATVPPEEASVQIPKPARTPSTPPEIVPSPLAAAPAPKPTIAFEAPQMAPQTALAANETTAEPEASPKPPSARPERRPTTGPPPAFVLEAMAATAAQVEKRRRHRAEQASGKALLGWARRTLGNVIPSDRGPERKRGPLTPAAAEHQLEDAATGEQALAIFFAFARQYFEYSALFMVHGDLAAGHDASGPGASGEKVRAIGVALDLPSALSYAKDRGTPQLLNLKRIGLDADLRADLARSAAHEVLVLPIVMRGRCVALLYGDDGEQPVNIGDIGDVVAMASLLTTMLERILLRKKRAALRDPSAVKSKLKSSVDRASISASDPAGPPVSLPPAGLDDVAAKRGGWSEEDLVEDGWTIPSDAEPQRSSVRPSPLPAKKSPAPPPPQVAAVRPIAKQPIRREDSDDSPPELIISEAEDAAEMSELLTEIEQNPSPQPPPALRSLSALASPELVRRQIDPMASASMSAAPHPPPPPSQGPFRNLPSVLIRSDLVDQVIAGGDRAEKALGEILALGEAAIPSVFARFPGPLTVDRNQALGELPRPADCGPVLRIVAAMRRLALPFLAVRSADVDVEVRFWATYLLGELNYTDAAQALLPRLFDENPTVRRIAVRSSRSLVAAGEQGAPIRKTLERMIGQNDEPQQRRLVAISTIGELKLYRSIPALIQVLSDPIDAIADAALRSLVAMTRQEYGKDRKKWTEWWETKGKKRLA